ncbi:MAG: thioredoxin domain-containing protein [Gammaproteobacteria bacterium]
MPNHLADETSPYLQQHAGNPVDWHPWSAQALTKARSENKPILLSIGYSACHWCHVMAHESFEDEATARVMNQLFVNIKIDREERPDIDKIYQTAQYLLTQRSGGWPLTMFLTPHDHVPFFGGTYFPNKARHGLPGFVDLLFRVDQFYRENSDDIGQQNRQMLDALDRIHTPQSDAREPDPASLDAARAQIEQSFDPRNGGFGHAPKFPHPADIDLLLRRWRASTLTGRPDQRGLHIATFTLEQMALGGIYDHLGGGFCRYSVDDYWMIPHFEKMLYDNGPLLQLCAQSAAATGRAVFARAGVETADWVMREMQSPEGGYYSTLDADSEGEEGKFYVWDREQVAAVADPQDHAVFVRRFGLDRNPNFEGKWHLHAFMDLPSLADEFKLDESETIARIDRVRAALFSEREKRIRPGRDEKILTSWNALMIKGMAIAGRYLNKPTCIDSAVQAVDFIRTTLWRDGRLLATYKDGKAHLNAYLDDHAFLIDALLELLQVRWRTTDLEFAVELANVLLEHFADRKNGGFYFTSDDHEQLIQRPKPLADEATPSGNGVAALGLARLGYLVGETRYLEAAESTLRHAAAAMAQAPMGHATLLMALEEYVEPPQIIILRGSTQGMREWHTRCLADYAPHRLSFAVPHDAAELPDALTEKRPHGDKVAYVCTGTVCSAPLEKTGELEEALIKTAV